MGEVPLCSTPLSGGLPCGRSLEKNSYLCKSVSISFGCLPTVIPKSYHHHVIRPLSYILALNPNTWSGNPCCLSILHENTQHRAFPMNHERYLARTSFIMFAIIGATAYGLWSISISNLNCSIIEEKSGTMAKMGRREVSRGF